VSNSGLTLCPPYTIKRLWHRALASSSQFRRYLVALPLQCVGSRLADVSRTHIWRSSFCRAGGGGRQSRLEVFNSTPVCSIALQRYSFPHRQLLCAVRDRFSCGMQSQFIGPVSVPICTKRLPRSSGSRRYRTSLPVGGHARRSTYDKESRRLHRRPDGLGSTWRPNLGG
jgi:hypothetical protein